jgi:thiosulfate/3-mercaptopyruvate sulfurtransferase
MENVAMSDKIEARGYAHPEVLVSTDWVEQHLNDPSVRIIESNEDTLLYSSGHVPGAVHVDWTSDLNDQLRRDYITRDGFERLMSRIGATTDTTVVFYGDKNNWWACYAFWVFQLFGHSKAKIMDGGRIKWEKEKRPLSRDLPKYAQTTYKAQDRADSKHRAFRDEVLAHMESRGQLVDVRSPEEYAGTRAAEDLLRREAAVTVAADDRLLQNRRAQQPHVVRAQVPARFRQRPQLRRQLDRVGQYGECAD